VRPLRTGFTLIEVLVVVAVLAVVVGAIMLSTTGLDARRANREAERLFLLLQLACEQAELGGREIGIHMASGGYGFSLASQERWLPFAAGHRLQERQLEGASLEVPSVRLPDHPDYERAPQAVCWPTGELSPLEVRIVHAGLARARVRTGADARPLLETSGDGRAWHVPARRP